MKIFHTSDIHLGKKPQGSKEFSETRYNDYFNAFDQLIDKAIKNEVDLFAIAGDFFDKSSINPDILIRTEESLKRLKDENIICYAISGNHDQNTNKNEDNWVEYLANSGYIIKGKFEKIDDDYKFEVFQKDGINFYGVDFSRADNDEILLNLSEQLDENQQNIVFMHTSDRGYTETPGIVSTETIKAFKGKCIYLGGGHSPHSYRYYPSDEPYFFIPGSPEFCDIKRETSDEKGGILFDTNERKHEFIPIEHRKRIKFNFECNVNPIDEFREKVKELKLAGGELVIANISADSYIGNNDFIAVIKENNPLWYSVEISLKGEKKVEDINLEMEPIEMAEEKVIKKWKLYKDSKKIVEYLQRFKECQKDKDREEEFIDYFDKMVMEELENDNN